MVTTIYGVFWARVMSSNNETDDPIMVRHISSGEETNMISGHWSTYIFVPCISPRGTHVNNLL